MKMLSTEINDSLRKSMKEVAEARDKAEICEKIELLLLKLVPSNYASLFIFNKKQQLLHSFNDGTKLSMLSAEGCIGKVFFTKKPKIYNHLISDKDYVEKYDNPNNHKLKCKMLVPIIEDNSLMGIISVSRNIASDTKNYTKDDLERLYAIESYLIKVIRTLSTKKRLQSDEKSLQKAEEKIKQLEENTKNIDINNTLLFLSSTVHDIRTPANSLYGYLELMEEQIQDKRLKEFLAKAKESANFINTLTNTILERTKNKYEENISKVISVNCVKFLADTANIFSAKMIEKEIDYFIFISPNLPKEIEIDTLKLKRVLINLIGNAYKFTPKKNSIELYIDCDENQTKMNISVKDTGIGIEKESQKKLFQAFTQATDTTNIEYGGTGLGLAISSEYVYDLGGELKLNSTIGVGSEFYFTIPLTPATNTSACDSLYDFEKNILILIDDITCKHAKFMLMYMSALGIPEKNISISASLQKNITHLICFEHKLSNDVYDFVKINDIKLLQIEEKLFSLSNNNLADKFDIASKNTFYGNAIYQLLRDSKKTKVLIIDDNKINVDLLMHMLASNCIDVFTSIDSNSGLKILKNATLEGSPFDILYLDKHMPELSGTELLKEFRVYEKKNHLSPIYAVSITGDPDISKEEEVLFDRFVTKPFNKKEVRAVIESSE